MSFNNLFYLFRYRQERGNNCTKSHNSFVRFMGIGGNQEPPDFVVSNTAFLIVPSSKSWLPRIIKLSKKTVKSLIKELSYFDSFCLITYFLKQNKNNSFFIMMCVKIFVKGKQKTQKKNLNTTKTHQLRRQLLGRSTLDRPGPLWSDRTWAAEPKHSSTRRKILHHNSGSDGAFGKA